MTEQVTKQRGGSSGSSPNGAQSDEIGNKRKRKQRRTLSCAECRRLKLKCDRIVPCTNCTKRACADICPSGVRSTAKASADENSGLKARLEALEKLLQPASGSSHMAESTVEPARKRVKKGVTVNPNPVAIIQAVSDPQTNQVAGPSSSSVRAVSPGDVAPPVYSSVRLTEPESLRFDYNIPTSPRSTSTQQAAVQSASSWIGLPRTTQNNPTLANEETVPLEQSYGTLVISKTGGSKYYGHTAASEWLKEQEVQDVGDGTSPRPSRMPTPERRDSTVHLQSISRPRVDRFPFQTEPGTTNTAFLLSHLPTALEGRVLMDSYYRYFAWHFDVAPRSTLQPIFDDAYAAKYSRGDFESKIDSHQLALLYMVLAMGARHSLELPQDDPSAEDYMTLAKRSLAKSDFLTHCTIAAVQTLNQHIMAHYHLETEKGRNGDQAWPLWGMAMRLLQAMGLHRDGTRWNLDPPVIEERRRVFWECYSADVFQANCFSRPNSIGLQYIDAAYPEQRSGDLSDTGARHDVLKFELSRLSSLVLDLALRVEGPPYSDVTEVHTRISAFERDIPYDLRCRDALLALPSVYPDAETAMRESPEVTRKDLPKTLQQYTLALNVTEAMLFLHRPYFAKALHERKPDPIQTPYGPSYLCVIERCNVMIQICAGIYRLHPLVIARHWHFWYHAFNAAVCMGTLILQNPRNILASYALSLIDTAIGLHAHILQTNPTGRLGKNLEWLLRLKQRATARIESTGTEETREDVPGSGQGEEDTLELIGWRTRLVERLGKGSQKVTTITPTASTTTPSPNTSIMRTISQALQDHMVPSIDVQVTAQLAKSSSEGHDHATDMLLHQFWDPMLMQEPLAPIGDELTNAEWWNWEPSN